MGTWDGDGGGVCGCGRMRLGIEGENGRLMDQWYSGTCIGAAGFKNYGRIAGAELQVNFLSNGFGARLKL